MPIILIVARGPVLSFFYGASLGTILALSRHGTTPFIEANHGFSLYSLSYSKFGASATRVGLYFFSAG